eukprot:gene10140-13642_t
MLEKAKETTREGKYTHVEYARFADDVVIMVDGHPKWDWLWAGINKRLREELDKLQVHINEEKTRQLDLVKGDSFGFLGFEFRRLKTKTGKWRVNYQPKMEARSKVIGKIRDVFRRHESQPLTRVRDLINPILRGWVQYFKIGNSSKVFGYVKDWLTRKIRRHLMKAKGKQGFGWKEWSTKGLYAKSLGKRSALNAHAAFDEAGGGNMICKTNAPLLDPTREELGVKLPLLTRLSARLSS